MGDFGNGFRGAQNGSVQTVVTDQPGQGVPGMLMYASDNILTDTFIINQTGGIASGRGVVRTVVTETASNLQRPNDTIGLPDAGSLASDFAGITVFEEHGNSDENGVSGWADGRTARLLRAARAAGRIYVRAQEAILRTDTIHWVIVAPTDESYAVGEFSPNALGGGAAGTSVELLNVRWETVGAAGGIAGIELLGTSVEFGS